MSGKFEDMNGLVRSQNGVDGLSNLDKLCLRWVGSLSYLYGQSDTMPFGVVRPDRCASNRETQHICKSPLDKVCGYMGIRGEAYCLRFFGGKKKMQNMRNGSRNIYLYDKGTSDRLRGS